MKLFDVWILIQIMLTDKYVIILKSHVLFSFSIAYFLLNVALLSDEYVNAETTIESITN